MTDTPCERMTMGKKWKKLEPIGAQSRGCLNCPPHYRKLSMHAPLAVGFGFVVYLRIERHRINEA
jgi:hypothetical protein